MKKPVKPIPGGRVLLWSILQALIVLAIAVGVGLLVFVPLVQKPLLESTQRWEVEYLYGGAINLLAQELNAFPAEQREQRLAELADRFGFEVALQALTEFDTNRLAPDERTRLQHFEAVGDPSDYSIFRLLAGKEQVLAFLETGIPAAHLVAEGQRRSMGTIAMLEMALAGKPEDEWPATVATIARGFEYPVTLVPAGNIELAPDELRSLASGRIVTVATEQSETADYPAEFAYKQVGNSVLVLGPFSPPTLRRYYPIMIGYSLMLGIFFLIPLGLWLAPTWRSMNQLSTATAAFGQGNFAMRADTIRGSRVNHLIAVFNQMASKIQGLVESNKALINAVSHELRTPISRIEFNIELARQSNNIEERNVQLGRIEDSVDELKTMVSEMLQYARFDREKPNFEMETVNIREWLESERKNWLEGESGLDIRIAVTNAQLQASIERYHMSRAISNLVRNAIRFAKSSIVVSARRVNGKCEIAVEDDGPGVDYQERTRIFEPFVRKDQSRNRESGGTGLGLAIVKQIVDWHAGEVWVEDAASGGARFVVRWPVNERT